MSDQAWTIEPCYVKNAERTTLPRGKPRFAVVTPQGRDWTYKITLEEAQMAVDYYNNLK